MTWDNGSLSKIGEKLLPYAERYASERSLVLKRELGAGGSASVFLVGKPDGGESALKVYDPKFFDEENGPAERRRIELQRKLISHQCPTLVDVFGIYAEYGTCFIDMEFLDWKSLKDLLADVPEASVESLFCQLVDSVNFLDSVGLVHRDIKPENILVSPDYQRLKLIDLGVMRETGAAEDSMDSTDHGLRRPFIASAQYSSPEYLFRLKEPSVEMWRALTIYQLGGVLHDLVKRKPLFFDEVRADNKFSLAMAVLTKVPNLNDVPSGLKQWAIIASSCLVKDPDLRQRLVSLETISSLPKSGGDRLRHAVARRTAMRSAATAQGDRDRRIMHARKKTLDDLGGVVKRDLVGVVDKQYGLVVSTIDGKLLRLRFDLGGSAALNVECAVEWLSEFTPLIGNSYLMATIGDIPSGASLRQIALGQIAADDELDRNFAQRLFDVVCDLVAAVLEHLDVGGEVSEIPFIDAAILYGASPCDSVLDSEGK